MTTTAIAADFRNSNWGDSIQSVRKAEKIKPVHETANRLGYETELAGLKADVLYKFDSGNLANAAYNFEESHTNLNDYIEDYFNLTKKLNAKYGTRVLDEVNWKDDLYKELPQKWGMAISIGHLEYISEWETDRTIVRSILTGDNYKITHMILYVDKEYMRKRLAAPESTEGL